jgi:hypothetical protein
MYISNEFYNLRLLLRYQVVIFRGEFMILAFLIAHIRAMVQMQVWGSSPRPRFLSVFRHLILRRAQPWADHTIASAIWAGALICH